MVSPRQKIKKEEVHRYKHRRPPIWIYAMRIIRIVRTKQWGKVPFDIPPGIFEADIEREMVVIQRTATWAGSETIHTHNTHIHTRAHTPFRGQRQDP